MGGKANRLINEKSPYLLQHAFNPVDWYPWGEEAFVRAGKENKPIFLSIGYSTCHWCHVMERESFENPEIAALLNRWFVCIKVDREERPDIDQLYMAATQVLTGSGGWPMSLFLLPDGKPFYAGTYFPPESQYGRPGFSDVLRMMHDAWLNKRNDLNDLADQLMEGLEDKTGPPENVIITEKISAKTFKALSDDFEPGYGGFSHAPKFPRTVVLDFLFTYWRTTRDEKALAMAVSTLSHMANGGIQDHLGGGFHRYATDPHWRVPHFEKMLYDQALLAKSYLDAFVITKETEFSSVVEDILGYVSRDLTSPEGGFYSAEDADSEDPYKPGEHGEGAFYLWTGSEIRDVLGEKESKLFFYGYGIRPDGNAPEDPQGEFAGKNILYLAHGTAEIARYFSMTEAEVGKVLARGRKKLLARRNDRLRAHLDDKILVGWNGLMIGAFARAGFVLGRDDYTHMAVLASSFLHNNLYDEKTGSLYRCFRDGQRGVTAQLDDYAFLVSGLLDLYEATRESRWLAWANRLTHAQFQIFYDKEQGGFFDSVADESLALRMKGDYDGALPAANTVTTANLVRLGRLLDNRQWLETAENQFRVFGQQLSTFPRALPGMAGVLLTTREKPVQVIITGSTADPTLKAMLRALAEDYDPVRTVLVLDSKENRRFFSRYLPFIETVVRVDNKTTAYVCHNLSCDLPVTDVTSLLRQLHKPDRVAG